MTTNHLSSANSPYLLQHAHNPVDWYPWGEEALARAQAEDKPIFLSIGYAACHWCHVMAHESFEDPATAELMNRHFINIKVDREERPDLDSIYMNAVVALTGQGGWPMSVFLTPSGEPFMGGTYFPPTARYGMPSFRELLTAIAQLWQEDRPRVLQAGQGLLAHLAAADSHSRLNQAPPLGAEPLDAAARVLASSYDRDFGGWGAAPKFPQPMAIEFLLRRAARGEKRSLQVAAHALVAMSAGGMYDVVGGGFARYSTDTYWRVPHFEKMLYDNAQLALAYLHAYLITHEARHRRICEETLDFIARELMAYRADGSRLHGGFFSSLDADSEGEEGRFYLWSVPELRAALPNPDDFALILAAYGLDASSAAAEVLQRARDDASLAAEFGLETDDLPARLDDLHARLLAARAARVRPATDDKVLTAWNGLALRAFAEAARYLERTDYLEIARHNADFLLTELNPNDDLRRAWRAGQAGGPAFLEDYAALALGLFALYQTDADPYWYASACRLLESLQARFADPDGGWFDTQEAHTGLITRPKDIQDNATPSGNALAALAALQLAAFSGEDIWRARAEAALRPIQPLAAAHPTAFAQWLSALDLAVQAIRQVALLGPEEDGRTRALAAVVWAAYRPDVILARATFPPPPNSPPLLEDRPLRGDAPTAYVCTGFVCRQPTTSPEELAEQLSG